MAMAMTLSVDVNQKRDCLLAGLLAWLFSRP